MTNKMYENANKVTFLVSVYPEHTLPQIIELLQMPAIDINAGLWYAQELGFLSQPDPDTNTAKLLKTPEVWTFGQAVYDLEEALLYCFRQLAEKETDMEETYLSNWTADYPSHDVTIALKHLEAINELAQYAIEDDANMYTFFTLPVNKDKLWGKKQFKHDPLPQRKLNNKKKK